jgi:protein tyrosine/serine phosphatase
LLAAGVSREQIVTDYLLSNDLLVRKVERWRSTLLEEGIDPAPILENMRLRPRYLLPTLDVIEGEFGGIDGYLVSIGVPHADLAEVRRILIEPA